MKHSAPITPARLAIVTVLAASACMLTGCINPKYQLAQKGTPAPLLINLSAAQPPVTATLHSVVVLHGPGSWKRAAYWDEYIVTLANEGDAPLLVESATLTDFAGEASPAGTDPWLLDTQSITYADAVNRRTNLVLGHIGTGGVTVGSLGAAALMAGATPVVAAASLVVVPAYFATIVVKNKYHKRAAVTEFNRRRLALPLMVAPRQNVAGSLFFRISPGPRQLVLRCRVGDDLPQDVTITLASLAHLHLKPAPQLLP